MKPSNNVFSFLNLHVPMNFGARQCRWSRGTENVAMAREAPGGHGHALLCDEYRKHRFYGFAFIWSVRLCCSALCSALCCPDQDLWWVRRARAVSRETGREELPSPRDYLVFYRWPLVSLDRNRNTVRKNHNANAIMDFNFFPQSHSV